MAYRSLLHRRILPAAAGAALRRPAAGSRLFGARLHQGNGRQRSSSSSSEFLGADFRRARGNDLNREMEQILQMAEENSKRWSQEWEELEKLRRLHLEKRERNPEKEQKILDVATGVSAGFFLVGIASYNNLI